MELKLEDEKGKNYTTGRAYFLRLENLLKGNHNIIFRVNAFRSFIIQTHKKHKEKRLVLKIVFVMLNNPNQCIARIKHQGV